MSASKQKYLKAIREHYDVPIVDNYTKNELREIFLKITYPIQGKKNDK